MNTPWGKSDSKIDIERGVSWVGTPSHGGLAVTMVRAMQVLSQRAINIALVNIHGTALVNKPKGSYIFFEEDCAYAVAFYEHPEWYQAVEKAQYNDYANSRAAEISLAVRDAAAKHLANSQRSPESIRQAMATVIRSWFPQYFAQEVQP